MALLSAWTRGSHTSNVQYCQAMGGICATIIWTLGLLARSRVRIAVNASKIMVAGLLFETSLVPKFISTRSVGWPSNQVARSCADDMNGSLESAPPGRPVLVAFSTSV